MKKFDVATCERCGFQLFVRKPERYDLVAARGNAEHWHREALSWRETALALWAELESQRTVRA